MAWAAIAVGVGSAVAGAVTANKNAHAARAGAPKGVDINQLISDARTNAADNLKNSIGLEAQYLPGTAALRRTADTGLGDLASGNTAGFAARDKILGDISSSTLDNNPLLAESTGRILSNLRMGGNLDPETQNAAARNALQTGGAAGISGSGAGRGLVARDLGLTSLQLRTQREQQALSAGSNLSQLRLQDILGRGGFAANAAGQDASRALSIASLIDSRGRPEAGLSANSIANLSVGNNNINNAAQAQIAQSGIAQNNANLQSFNSLFGTVAGAYGSSAAPTGIGSATTYADFLKNNPTSSAANGGLAGYKSPWT